MRLLVRMLVPVSAMLTAALCVSATAAQQPKLTPASASADGTSAPSQTQKDIEAYLRNLYAFGPDVKVLVGPLKPSPVEGMMETDIDVTIGENKQNATFYVSKDGKYLFRGDMSDMTKDPLAANIAEIRMADAPVLGDAKAPVTIVEYSDFECPVCRSLHDAMRGMLSTYAGKIRVVFKDFPLDQIHPWAKTAAIAGRCAYQQKPEAFWKMYDLIYDNQETISAADAWSKMVDYAGQSALDTEALKACMASPEAAAAVNASHANGETLEVTSTPTVFVNGRRMVGADSHLLEQYINYELAKHNTSKSAATK